MSPAAVHDVPAFLFAHGAGASSSSAWMRAWAERLGSLGVVETFDYPYMAAGRKRPDRQPELIAAHRRALATLRARHAGPVVLAGKSMGSRIGCHVALEEKVTGLVCFGYPLQAAGSGKLRDEVLLALDTPVLFITGTRDPLCPLEGLERVRARMQAPSDLFVVQGGNHSLDVTARELRAQNLTRADVDARILERIRQFLAERLAITS